MASNIGEDSVHFIGQASAFTVGANLVTNGDFTGSADGWNLDASFTYLNNAIKIEGDTTTDFMSQTGTSLTLGKMYRITYTLSNSDLDGLFRLDADSAFGQTTLAKTDGTHTIYMQKTNATPLQDVRFHLAGSSTPTVATLDNISVVEWVGDSDAGGGCTIDTFTGDLTDYMTADGGVLDEQTGLVIDDNAGQVRMTYGPGFAVTPLVGSFVKCDFSAPLVEGDDGIYQIVTATSTALTIDLIYGIDDDLKTASVWIGGAFPDIATANNDSTLSEDFGGFFWKRSICVNVPQLVDATTTFATETEATIRAEDGSRKLIGFYDTIEAVNPGDGAGANGYRIVSDMDQGGTYYGGALTAFQLDEGFTITRPNAVIFGSDLVTNGDFSSVGGGGTEIFTDWGNSASGANTEVQNVDPGEFHDDAAATGGACNLWTDNETLTFIRQDGFLTVGKRYRLVVDIWINAGSISFRDFSAAGSDIASWTTSGNKKVVFTATDEGIAFIRGSGTPIDGTIDNVSVTEVTTPAWVDWDAQENDIAIATIDSSNVEIRNMKIFNTINDAGGDGIFEFNAIAGGVNLVLTNCYFDQTSNLIVDNLGLTAPALTECYLGDEITSVSMENFIKGMYVNCIGNGTGTNSTIISSSTGNTYRGCLFYGGVTALGMAVANQTMISNCTFYKQTVTCIRINGGTTGSFTYFNNIFVPTGTGDLAVYSVTGTISPAGYNNIMWTIAGFPMTNPVVHDDITPNSPLPIDTIEADPQFVNPADGDFRLRSNSPAINGGLEDLFGGSSTIGGWAPAAGAGGGGYRSRYG